MSTDVARQLQYFAFSAPMAVLVAIFFALIALVILVTFWITRAHILKFIHLHMDVIQKETVISLQRALKGKSEDYDRLIKETRRLKRKSNRQASAAREAQVTLTRANMENEDE